MRSRLSWKHLCRPDLPSSSSVAVFLRRRTRASATPSRMSSSAASRAIRRVLVEWLSMAEDRFARAAPLIAAQQDARAAELAARVHAFALPQREEHAVDVGCGAGALALALAP